jgi:vacuolar protein sorting-associated protein 13A/C
MEAINRMNDKPKDHYATTHDETTANLIFAAAKDKLPVILEDETATAIPKRRDKRGSVVDSVKIKVLAKMEDVTVEMQTDKRSLACLEVSIS